jgi:hypothetical protein
VRERSLGAPIYRSASIAVRAARRADLEIGVPGPLTAARTA